MGRVGGEGTIVVLDLTPENARELATRPPVTVVWSCDIVRLEAAVACRLHRSVRLEFMSLGDSLALRDQELLHIVRSAICGTPAIISVDDLARRFYMSPSALRSRWRRAGIPSTPRALSDWNIVLALAEAREQGTSIEAVARSLRAHETTVYRAVRRLLGCRPASVTRALVLDAARGWWRVQQPPAQDNRPLDRSETQVS
jgi:AraC-like DNA-binding protein